MTAQAVRAEEEPVPANDPRRDPDWCWTHGAKYPACAERHADEQ